MDNANKMLEVGDESYALQIIRVLKVAGKVFFGNDL